jgi:O-antigen ligase
MLIAGIRDLKIGVLALIPVMAVIVFGLAVVNSEVMPLPKQVQRGLAFLPGSWDSDMVLDAAASNDFRFSIWSLWWKQYFPEKPLLGRGFGFNSEWTKKSIYYGNAADYKQMVETGNLHNGFLASLDTVGIVGTIFFIAWNFTLLIRTWSVPFDRRGGAYFAFRFIALYLAVSILSCWIGASSMGTFLPQEFALAGLFLRLRRDLAPAEAKKRNVAPAVQRQFRRELAQA